MEDLLKIKEVISKNKDITILSHLHPDGDALGSQLALALGLEQLGKNVTMFNKDPIPDSYHFLKNWQFIKPLEENAPNSPVVICVDCASWARVGYNNQQIIGNDAVVINLDHHISNTNFGNLNWVQPNAAATCELIYDLLGLLQVKIDKSIATCLYTGISTDTGSFIYENTSATTHMIVSDLITRGADVNLLRRNYYENINLSKMKLLKFSLNNLGFTTQNQIAWVALDRNVIDSVKATDNDAEGLINYLKNICGVEIAIIFREITSTKIKISFRSKNRADVNNLAALFGGGGHPRAAGCIIEGNLEQVVLNVIKAAEASLA